MLILDCPNENVIQKHSSKKKGGKKVNLQLPKGFELKATIESIQVLVKYHV